MCIRTAAICCLRALLDQGCNYGRELAHKNQQCFIDINESAGAVKKVGVFKTFPKFFALRPFVTDYLN